MLHKENREQDLYVYSSDCQHQAVLDVRQTEAIYIMPSGYDLFWMLMEYYKLLKQWCGRRAAKHMAFLRGKSSACYGLIPFSMQGRKQVGLTCSFY